MLPCEQPWKRNNDATTSNDHIRYTAYRRGGRGGDVGMGPLWSPFRQGIRGRPQESHPFPSPLPPLRGRGNGQGDRKGRPYYTTKRLVKPVYSRGGACPFQV